MFPNIAGLVRKPSDRFSRFRHAPFEENRVINAFLRRIIHLSFVFEFGTAVLILAAYPADRLAGNG